MKREPKRMEIGIKAKEKPLTKSGLKLITLYRFPTMPFDVFVSLNPHQSESRKSRKLFGQHLVNTAHILDLYVIIVAQE